MTIQNGYGIVATGEMGLPLPGTPSSPLNLFADSVVNPSKAQVSRVALSGTGSGTATNALAITLPWSGEVITLTTAALVTPAAADVAAALEVLVNASDDLLGIVTANDAGSGNLDLTFDPAYAGVSFTVGCTPQAGVSASVTATTAAGGSVVPFGRVVKRSTVGVGVDDLADTITLPENGNGEALIRGVLIRPNATFSNLGTNGYTDEDGLPVGAVGSVLVRGDVWVRNARGSASKGGTVYFQTVANGGVAAGSLCASDDGSNAEAFSASRAEWLTDTAAGEIGLLRLK